MVTVSSFLEQFKSVAFFFFGKYRKFLYRKKATIICLNFRSASFTAALHVVVSSFLVFLQTLNFSTFIYSIVWEVIKKKKRKKLKINWNCTKNIYNFFWTYTLLQICFCKLLFSKPELFYTTLSVICCVGMLKKNLNLFQVFGWI